VEQLLDLSREVGRVPVERTAVQCDRTAAKCRRGAGAGSGNENSAVASRNRCRDPRTSNLNLEPRISNSERMTGTLDHIEARITAGERLSFDDGVRLFREANPLQLSAWANLSGSGCTRAARHVRRGARHHYTTSVGAV